MLVEKEVHVAKYAVKARHVVIHASPEAMTVINQKDAHVINKI